MKITELRIGDKVQNKRTKFPMIVVGILAGTSFPTTPDKGTVQLDFYGNEGDVWEESVEDLEFCEPRYKLPEWKKDEDSDSIVSSITATFFTIEYVVDEYSADSFCLFFSRNVGDTTNCKRIGVYSTLAEAQEAAEKHYNELASKLIEGLTIIKTLTNKAMSEEIKFRGKSLKTREWLFGSLWIEGEKYYIIHGPNLTTVTEVDPNTVGQYSGVKDKNGVEIYKGDAVKYRGFNEMKTSYVEFEAGAFIVGYHNGSSTKKRPMLLNSKMEVVGNIHDKSEKLARQFRDGILKKHEEFM